MIRRVIVKDFSAQSAKGEGQRMKEVPKGRYGRKGHDAMVVAAASGPNSDLLCHLFTYWS